MPLPPAFGTVTIVEDYVDFTGAVGTGTVTFIPVANDWLDMPGSNTIIVPKPITVGIDANGHMTITVPLTDDPDVVPTYTYSVTENVSGLSRTRTIEVPSALLPGPLVLSDLAPTNAGSVGTTALTKAEADAFYAPIGGGTVDTSALLAKANNLSDVPNKATARTNLGLGTSATQPTSAFDTAGAATTAQAASLQKSSNLSDLASAATARTNLGLGTAATSAATAFDAAGAATTAQAASLQKTANLSDVASAATARTNLGLATVAASGSAADLTGTLADARLSTAVQTALLRLASLQQPPIQVFLPGVAAVATNILPPGIRVAADTIINGLYLRAGTVPTGSGLTVAIRRNGTVWQTLTIAAAQSSVSLTGIGASVSAGDIFTFDITAVGSTVAGADLALDLVSDYAATPDTPLGVTGVLGRWRADSLTTSVLNGGVVSTWTDYSGNGRTLTGASGPTLLTNVLNGHAAVRFDNSTTGKWLSAVGFTINQPYTQVIVARTNNTAAESLLMDTATSPGASTGIKFTKVTMSAPTFTNVNPVLSNDTWYGIYAGFSGAASTQQVRPLTNPATVNPGTDAMQGVTIGNNYAHNSTGGIFDIAEAIIFDHVLTAGDITAMNTYLTARYGIV